MASLHLESLNNLPHPFPLYPLHHFFEALNLTPPKRVCGVPNKYTESPRQPPCDFEEVAFNFLETYVQKYALV